MSAPTIYAPARGWVLRCEVYRYYHGDNVAWCAYAIVGEHANGGPPYRLYALGHGVARLLYDAINDPEHPDIPEAYASDAYWTEIPPASAWETMVGAVRRLREWVEGLDLGEWRRERLPNAMLVLPVMSLQDPKADVIDEHAGLDDDAPKGRYDVADSDFLARLRKLKLTKRETTKFQAAVDKAEDGPAMRRLKRARMAPPPPPKRKSCPCATPPQHPGERMFWFRSDRGLLRYWGGRVVNASVQIRKGRLDAGRHGNETTHHTVSHPFSTQLEAQDYLDRKVARFLKKPDKYNEVK